MSGGKNRLAVLLIMLFSLGYIGAVFTGSQAQLSSQVSGAAAAAPTLQRFVQPMTDCEAFALELGFGQGTSVRVTPGPANRFRAKPNTNAEVLGTLSAGTEFIIMGSPYCDVDKELLWLQIDYEGTIGWTVGAQDNTPFVELVPEDSATSYEACPDAPLSNIVVGSVIRITDEHGLREIGMSIDFDERDWSYAIGEPYEVLAGPICRDRSAFWKIETAPGYFIWVREAFEESVFLLQDFRKAGSITTPAAVPTTEATPEPTQSEESNCLRVTATSANLRSGAGTGYPIVGSSTQGETYQFITYRGYGDNRWYLVDRTGDEEVWISSTVVTLCSNTVQPALATVPSTPMATDVDVLADFVSRPSDDPTSCVNDRIPEVSTCVAFDDGYRWLVDKSGVSDWSKETKGEYTIQIVHFYDGVRYAHVLGTDYVKGPY